MAKDKKKSSSPNPRPAANQKGGSASLQPPERGAQAYTTGQDLIFGGAEQEDLLGHEAAHTMQQMPDKKKED